MASGPGWCLARPGLTGPQSAAAGHAHIGLLNAIIPRGSAEGQFSFLLLNIVIDIADMKHRDVVRGGLLDALEVRLRESPAVALRGRAK